MKNSRVYGKNRRCSVRGSEEESIIKKRFFPVLLASVLVYSLCACDAGRVNVSAPDTQTDGEVTFAQSVLTPQVSGPETDAASQQEAAKPAPVSVTLAHAETGADARVLSALTDAFNETNGYGITVRFSETGDMRMMDTKSLAAEADLSSSASPFADDDDVLAPLRALNGVPLDAEGSVFYYNKDLFDDLELTPPATWEDLETCGKKLMEEREMPLLCTDDACGLFEMLLRQSGTELMTGNRARFHNDAGRQTMAFLLPMLQSDYLVFCRDGRTSAEAFLEKRAAAFVGTSTELKTLQDAPFPVGTAPVFSGDFEAVPVHARLVATQTRDAAKQEACLQFLRYLTASDTDAKWAVATGRLPVRYSAFHSQTFLSYTEYDASAGACLEETDAFYIPAACPPYARETVRNLLEAYALRGVMPDEACRALEEEINTVIAE